MRAGAGKGRLGGSLWNVSQRRPSYTVSRLCSAKSCGAMVMIPRVDYDGYFLVELCGDACTA